MRSFLIFLLFFRDILCQCPPGYSQLFNNNQLVTCNPQNSCSCASIAAGYFCQFSNQNNQYVCCGIQSNQCPSSSAQLSTNGGGIQTCQSSANCAQGYFCNQNTCCASPSTQCTGGTTCPSGQVLVNGFCTNQVPLGSPCQSSLVCSGGGQCLNGFCQCPNGATPTNGQCSNGNNQCSFGSVFVSQTNQCLSMVAPGTQCTQSVQCLDSSTCNFGVCSCSGNTQALNGFCIPFNGGPCQQGQVLINNVCQTYATVGSQCAADAMCVGGSTCQNSVCTCPVNTQSLCVSSTNGLRSCFCINPNNPNNNNLIQIGSFGCSPISATIQCSGNAQCSANGQCLCPQNTVQQGNQCVSAGGGFCPTGQIMGSNGQCLQLVSPGSQCSTTTTQCLDGVCNFNTCSCQNNAQLSNSYCVPSSNGFCQTNQVSVNGQCMAVAVLGNNCQSDLQCLGGSNCLNGICSCSSTKQRYCSTTNGFQTCYCVSSNSNSGSCQNGQVLINGQCFNQVQLGNSCSFSQQCITTSSQCTNGFCQCQQGTTQQNGQCIGGVGNFCPTGQIMGSNGQCLQLVSPGSQCSTTTTQCLDGVCNFNTCSCQNNAQLSNGYCIPSSNGFCQMNQVSVNGQCMAVAVLGNNCQTDLQCLGGSNCLNGICSCSSTKQRYCATSNGFQTCYCVSSSQTNSNCQNGQVMGPNGQCLQLVSPGSQCSTTTTQCLDGICNFNTCSCQNNAQLSNGYCVPSSNGFCQTNQVSVNGQCMAVAVLGNNCQSDLQCLGGSNCLNGICSCSSTKQRYCSTANGFQTCYCVSSNSNSGNCQNGQVLINGQCFNQVQLGAFCSFSQQCSPMNSICQTNFCQCSQGFIQQNGQCISNGNNNGCGVNQVLINGQCFNQVQLGSSCSFSQQCVTSNAICNLGICQCAQGTTQQNGQCISGNSGCGPNQVVINGQCFNLVQLGAFCSFSQQCSPINSACQNNFCQCSQGFIQQNNQCIGNGNNNCGVNQVLINGQCFNQAQFGASCSFSQQCVTSNAVCQNGFCQCPQGSTLQGNQCSQTTTSSQVAPGGFCSLGFSQCLDSSVCYLNNCTCQNGGTALFGYCLPQKNDFCSQTQIQINGQCVTYSIVGGQCQGSDLQCLGGSKCNNGMCSCRTGQPTCLPNNQCYCPSTSGQCGSNQVLINGQCFNQAQLGASCSFSQQCVALNSVCQNGFCQCPPNTFQQNGQCVNNGNTGCGVNQVLINGQCFNRVQLGASCSFSQQCIATNSICQNGFCQCQQGATQQNGQCITNGNNGQCQSYQVLVGGSCLDTVSIGMTCSVQQQCPMNAICSGSCVCSSGLTYNGSACISSSVFCPQGTVVVSNVCRSLVSLNQFCQSTQQCIGFGSCVNSFCQCASGTQLINNVCRSSGSVNPCNSNQVLIGNMCYNTVPLGSNCMFSQQCQGNGQCTNSLCVCPSGTTNYGDGTCRGASNDGNLCSAGETPQYSNNQLINCLISACPSASYCKFNSQVSKYVCCRPGSSTLTCANPAYSVVYQNGQPLNCLLSPCPSNAICEYNNSSGQYVCCQTGGSTSSVCQGNYYTYSNGFPFVCTADSACTATTSNYRYCRLAPGQTFSVCCDRF